MMKKFVIKSLFFIIVINIPLFLLYFIPTSFISNPFALINNKIDLLKKIKSPKIIFISGSSLFYGLKAESVSKELKIPAINMGTFIGYGYSFMLDNVKPYINKDDIVILSPEYTLLYMNDFDLIDSYGITQMVVNFPFRHLKYISVYKSFSKLPQAYIYMIQYRFNNLRLIIADLIKNKKIPDKKYFTNGVLNWEEDISEFGDFIKIKIYTPFPKLGGRAIFPDKISEEQIKLINNYGEYVKSKGATPYFIFTNLVDDEYTKNKKQIDSYNEYLKKNLNIDIISSPEEFKFSYEYYFDTINHLNTYGRELFTNKIINILKNKLEKNNKKL